MLYVGLYVTSTLMKIFILGPLAIFIEVLIISKEVWRFPRVGISQAEFQLPLSGCQVYQFNQYPGILKVMTPVRVSLQEETSPCNKLWRQVTLGEIAIWSKNLVARTKLQLVPFQTGLNSCVDSLISCVMSSLCNVFAV